MASCVHNHVHVHDIALRMAGRGAVRGHLRVRDDCGLRHHQEGTFTDESRPRGGFIPAETLVQNGTAGDTSTAGGTLSQPALGFLVG